MQNNKSVSIIIPVYNAERFLKKCISSVEALTIDYELLLINDGSKDSSLEILKEFAKKNNRIKIFDIENSGVSFARNLGLKNATKENIIFIDADDWIDAKAFEKAFEKFLDLNADLAFTPFIKVQNKETFIPLPYQTKIFSEEEKSHFLLYHLAAGIQFMGGIWRTFYKKSLLENLTFDLKMKFHEDVFFLVQAVYRAKKMAFIDKAFYYYQINSTSVSFSKEINSIESRKLLNHKLKAFAKENHLDFSFGIMRRNCPIYARIFAKEAKETKNKITLFKKLWKIQKEIPNKEIQFWKPSYFGKSFLFYVFFTKFFGKFIGWIFLCLRFLFCN